MQYILHSQGRTEDYPFGEDACARQLFADEISDVVSAWSKRTVFRAFARNVFSNLVPRAFYLLRRQNWPWPRLVT